MNIKQEITDIILKHDFVIVPGVGAFLSSYSKPHFNQFGNIVESVRTLEFEPYIKKDFENKLFNLLSHRINIPHNYLLIEYSDFLEKIYKEIGSTGKYDWDGLGSFFMNAHKELEYYPESQKSKEITFEVPKATASSVQESFFSSAPISEKIETETTPILEPESVKITKELSNEKKTERIVKAPEVMLYTIPIILLLGCLIYAMSVNTSKKAEKPNLMAEVDSLYKIQETYALDADSITNNSPNIENLQLNTVTKDNNNAVETFKTDPKNNYPGGKIIKIGAYRNRENSDMMANYLAENGLPIKVRLNDGIYRIFVVSYSEEQTESFTQKIQDLTNEHPNITSK